MAIILLGHQPIDFTYKENEPCENLSDMCLHYETADNPKFQVKRSGSSVPLATIIGVGATDFEEVEVPLLSQSTNYFTYQINFEELGITEGCFQVCVYDATGATLVTNGTFGSSLTGWTVADGLVLDIASTLTPSGACDGEAELVATGGTPAYTYSMDGIIYQVSETFTGLCFDVPYTFYVKDLNNVVRAIEFEFYDCSSFAGSYAFDIKDIIAFDIKNCEAFDFV